MSVLQTVHTRLSGGDGALCAAKLAGDRIEPSPPGPAGTSEPGKRVESASSTKLSVPGPCV